MLASIILILVSMFGGDLFGSWFFNESEIKDSGFLLVEENSNFMLEEVEVKNNCDAPKAEELCVEYYGDIKDTNDYSYSSSGWEAMEDIMLGQVKVLLYVCLLTSCAILYFLNEEKKDNAAIACLLLSGICILIVLVFVITFPLAVEEDTKLFSNIDKSPSIYGNAEEESPDPNDNLTSSVKWRPGVAPLFILLAGIMALITFYDIKIKDNGETNLEDRVVNASGSNSDANVDVFKPKEDSIACPGCNSKMNVPILNKVQNVKCASCGLEGEIEK